MGGAVAIVVILLIFPILVGMSGAAGAGLLGWIIKRRVDEAHEGSELLDVNR
jgi:hypothetical protein